jgi:dCTP deaminase
MLSFSSIGTTPNVNSGASTGVKRKLATPALIDRRIAELAAAGMVRPFVEDCVQPCSYDVHLGEETFVEGRVGFEPFSLADYSPDKPFMLGPGQFMLGETIEYLSIPPNVEAHLHLVSSRAREGLNHSLAGLIDCGFEGKITLELKNILNCGHIPIYPGLRIAQLTFFEYDEPAQRPYAGRYFGDTKVSLAKDGADVLRLSRYTNL